jgi:hypothetical protein
MKPWLDNDTFEKTKYEKPTGWSDPKGLPWTGDPVPEKNPVPFYPKMGNYTFNCRTLKSRDLHEKKTNFCQPHS